MYTLWNHALKKGKRYYHKFLREYHYSLYQDCLDKRIRELHFRKAIVHDRNMSCKM